MPYLLRFVQHFRPSDQERFLALEAKFASMEKRRPDMPQGRRFRPYAGREPVHTLVWECEVPSLLDAQQALDRLGGDPEHEQLFLEQSPLMTDSYTEIYEVLDL